MNVAEREYDGAWQAPWVEARSVRTPISVRPSERFPLRNAAANGAIGVQESAGITIGAESGGAL